MATAPSRSQCITRVLERQDLEAYKQTGQRTDCIAITALQQNQAMRTFAAAMFEAADLFKAGVNMGRANEDWTNWKAELMTFAGSSPEGPELGRRVAAMSRQTMTSAIVFSASP
jgi:hypothetical protein